MALSLAIALAGFRVNDYGTLVSHLTGHDAREGRPSSPSSRSESSGVSSFAPSTIHTTAPSSPFSSRPETPNDDSSVISYKLPKFTSPKMSAIGTGRRKQKKKTLDRKPRGQWISSSEDENEKRDILDLMTNIKNSGWNVTHPDVYKRSVRSFMENRSVYFRLSEDALTEDYPVRECKQCNFREPSPYLCR
ncbi:uncharacterized protein LOC107036848 [Diachasma alloeum]|uniref:uncharacterized protein LOC107036848 n=1 Tax=Diachasma alloeum TaxID=454923 RepID=UPI0007381B5D|nr:uncharacterized protein LOC107036848 [Diachasma alloeum]